MGLFRSWYKCPRTVANVVVRYLPVGSYVNPGQLRKIPFLLLVITWFLAERNKHHEKIESSLFYGCFLNADVKFTSIWYIVKW